MRLLSGEMRIAKYGSLPVEVYTTLPIGYSSLAFPSTMRSTASDDPSGDQSASVTPSSCGRICPPEREPRASVPELSSGEKGGSRNATSLLEETASTLLSSGRLRSRDSGSPGMARKVWDLAPSHEAV